MSAYLDGVSCPPVSPDAIVHERPVWIRVAPPLVLGICVLRPLLVEVAGGAVVTIINVLSVNIRALALQWWHLLVWHEFVALQHREMKVSTYCPRAMMMTCLASCNFMLVTGFGIFGMSPM